MKKAFTLIELLAVIIVLAIVSLIAVPMILDVVEDSRKSADKSSVYMVADAAKNYYAESYLDNSRKDIFDGQTNLFNMIEMNNKPKEGQVYINEQGKVALVVKLNKVCYMKTFNTDIAEYDENAEECKLDVVLDSTAPVVTLEQTGLIEGNNGWYKETPPKVRVNVTDVGSGYLNYKWCFGIDCEPSNTETDLTIERTVEDGANTQLCVIAYDKAGNASDLVCTDKINLDTVKPSITGIEDIEINVGEEVDLIKDVVVNDTTSLVKDTFTVTPEKVETNVTGTKEVVYTVYDNAGNKTEITRKVIISAEAPSITFTPEEGAINDYGWAKEDFYVTIKAIDKTGKGIKEIKICTSLTDECDPEKGAVIENSDTAIRDIAEENNNNRICAKATDNDNQVSAVKCSDAYKLDKTAPITGTIEITGTKGENDWYTSNVEINKVDGSDSLSGHLETTVDKNSITENTEGEKVTVTTTDLAGNTSTREYTIKVDKTIPTATISKSVSNNKNVLTAVVTPADTLSGYVYEWYKDGSKIPNATGLSYVTTESGTYRFKVKTGSGKVVDSNEITIDGYTITYNLNGGTGSISSTTKIQDLSTSITSTIPTKEGYEFLGWGVSSTDTAADYSSNATYTSNESKTLYAIWKKTITVTFVGNGASIDKTSATCDMYNADTNCTVTFPTITREGFTITGFNTDSNATTAQVLSGKTAAVSANTTYYAITSKVVTVTFNKNGASAIGSTEQKCTIQNSATTCNITSPSITASSATPTVVGWDSTSSYTSNEWAVNTPKAFSTNTTYYAVTKKDAVTHSITYAKSTGVSAIGATSGSCNIAETYNGNSQSGSCNITLPTITLTSGYGSAGWYNASGTKLGNASASISVSSSGTITAKATTITCSAGYYLAANATSCTKCEAGSYCAGGTYTFASTVQGKSTCPSGYGTSAAGSDAASDCYKTITVTYAGNGATSGSTAASSCNAYYNNGSCQITLNQNGFTKTNYTFQGWGTGTTNVSYNAGTTQSFSSNTTLNAIWKSSSITISCSNYYSSTNSISWAELYCVDGKADVLPEVKACLDSAYSSSSTNSGRKTAYNECKTNSNYYNIYLSTSSSTYSSSVVNVKTVHVKSGASLPKIKIPTLTCYDFGGYYSRGNGNGTKYYDENGNGVAGTNVTSDINLYAYWIKRNDCFQYFASCDDSEYDGIKYCSGNCNVELSNIKTVYSPYYETSSQCKNNCSTACKSVISYVQKDNAVYGDNGELYGYLPYCSSSYIYYCP